MAANSVKCEVCGAYHPLSKMELAFRRPDDIAHWSDRKIKKRCQFNKGTDFYIVDGERFFLRGVIILPIERSGDDYAIGIWAETSQESFERIYDLWDDPDQNKAAPMRGSLANDILDLHDCSGDPIDICLVDPKKRPRFRILAENSGLWTEQRQGISTHRAHEYTSLIPREKDFPGLASKIMRLFSF